MLRIALPLALAELGWMAQGVVDITMAGRLPHSALAIGAVSIGNAIIYPFAIFGVGMMPGMDTLVSHAYGAGDLRDARRSLAIGRLLPLAQVPARNGLLRKRSRCRREISRLPIPSAARRITSARSTRRCSVSPPRLHS